MKVLVVDDDANMRKSMEMALTFAGHTVTLAQDGGIAIYLINREESLKEAYDFIITDCDMPWAEGDEVLRAALAKDPEAKVLVMSGQMGPETEKVLLEMGATAAFNKSEYMGPLSKFGLIPVKPILNQ